MLATARATLEQQGYLWSGLDATTAEAHERGTRVRGRLFTFRLRLGLTVDDGRLQLSALSTGLGLAGTTGSPAATMRIRRRSGDVPEPPAPT